MSIPLMELVNYLDDAMDVPAFNDYCPNGLQVEGRSEVKRLLAGVTASQALLELAVEREVDAVLVHHGYFWKGEAAPLTGIKAQRIRTLMRHNISLLAYHLPLDAHPQWGNNAQLARVLDFTVEGQVQQGPAAGLLWYGTAPHSDATRLAEHLQQALARTPLHIPAARPIQRIAWCTGAAQGFIAQAAQLGVDAYVTGEASEQTVHEAREWGLHFFAAGHHATERYGVQALAAHLQQEFPVKAHFEDLDNPV